MKRSSEKLTPDSSTSESPTNTGKPEKTEKFHKIIDEQKSQEESEESKSQKSEESKSQESESKSHESENEEKEEEKESEEEKKETKKEVQCLEGTGNSMKKFNYWVKDYEEAKAWFVEKLSFKCVMDVKYSETGRWIEVGPESTHTKATLAFSLATSEEKKKN